MQMILKPINRILLNEIILKRQVHASETELDDEIVVYEIRKLFEWHVRISCVVIN